MSSWSSRRKFSYGFTALLAVIVFIAVPAFLLFYKAPTCFDAKQNGNESGVDCGGSCSRLCQSAFLPPRIEWGGVKFEKLAEGLYNVASYIVNPNINGAAKDVPYKISLYDKEGIITERAGKISLHAHRDSLAFQTALNVGKRIPTKATFEFTSAPVWFKSHDTLEGIAVVNKEYKEDGSNSSLEITLENKTLFPYDNIQVSVVLYDIEDNAIGFSETFIDTIPAKGGREVAPYTWPISRNDKVKTITVLLSSTPAVDR